jgi:hypothetical protein
VALALDIAATEAFGLGGAALRWQMRATKPEKDQRTSEKNTLTRRNV